MTDSLATLFWESWRWLRDASAVKRILAWRFIILAPLLRREEASNSDYLSMDMWNTIVDGRTGSAKA